MFERIIACFGRYCGTGMMMGLFLISLIFLFFKEKIRLTACSLCMCRRLRC